MDLARRRRVAGSIQYHRQKEQHVYAQRQGRKDVKFWKLLGARVLGVRAE